MKKIIILILMTILLVSCGTKDTIPVGFVVGLSGPFANEGVFARNGFYLAIEEINEDGGVNGHLLEAVVKDDESSVEQAKVIDKEFYDEDVHLIIGHLISSTTPAILSGMENYNHLYISPTISTAELSDLDDNFYRVIGDSHMMAQGIFEMIEDNPIEHAIMIVQDLNNKAFTDVITNDLIDDFDNKGITFTGVHQFENTIDYEALIAQIKSSEANGLVLLSSSTTTADIIQHLNIAHLTPSIYVSTWALSAELILNGGKGTEGLFGVAFYDQKNLDAKQALFHDNYIKKFKTSPSSTSMFAYDAVYLLKEALEKSKTYDVKSVKEALDTIDTFEGLSDTFELNEFGDAIRSYVKIQVIDGEMQSIE